MHSGARSQAEKGNYASLYGTLHMYICANKETLAPMPSALTSMFSAMKSVRHTISNSSLSSSSIHNDWLCNK